MKLRISPNVSSRLSFEIGFCLQRILAAVSGRDDVHGDVACLRMMLQAVEHGPPVHDRQLHVEDDRVGLELVCEGEPGVAALRDDPLEASFTCDLELRAGELGVVLHDQDNAISVLDLLAVVADVARQEQRRIELGRLECRDCGRSRRTIVAALGREHHTLYDGALRLRMLDVPERGRQEERERTPLAEGALDMDLAAEQTCDLTADGESEPGPAISPARRPVGLLERFEDQAQLVLRNADARVLDRKLEYRLRPGESLAGELSPFRQSDPQLDAADFGELASVGEQVLEHLLQPLLVRLDRRRDVRAMDLDFEGELLVLGHRPERALDEVPQIRELDVADVHVHTTRLDLGEVEDVVDQIEEVGAGAVDRVRELDLLRVQVLVGVLPEQLRQDEQRIERSAQLVRHVREEFGLVQG